MSNHDDHDLVTYYGVVNYDPHADYRPGVLDDDEYDLDDDDRALAAAAAELVDYCASNVDDAGDFSVDVDHLVHLAAKLVIAAVLGDIHHHAEEDARRGAPGDAMTPQTHNKGE